MKETKEIFEGNVAFIREVIRINWTRYYLIAYERYELVNDYLLEQQKP
jgi:hypothetical protein